MNINPIILALITTGSALLGVIVSSFFNLRVARLTKESDERKHHKEIVINAAIENWKQTTDTAISSGPRPIELQPVDSYIVHMISLANVVFDPTTNADNLKGRLAEVDRMVTIAESSARNARIQRT